MPNEIREYASAKINLNLLVLPRREDGFHEIESIFQVISVRDELTVIPADGYDSCTIECQDMILPENNTLALAYKAFGKVTGIRSRAVSVSLVKKIPSGGGLGGGSSDAAALVRALEKLNGIKLSEEQLDVIASDVGSDVFFFMHCDGGAGGCAVVTGRGENVLKICRRSDLFFVLVFPGVHSSTREAYSLVDERNSAVRGICRIDEFPRAKDLERIYNLPVGKWSFMNSFTDVLSEKYPEIKHSIEELKAQKALFCDVSGSGSTVFGVFASRCDAENAVVAIKAKGRNCVFAE